MKEFERSERDSKNKTIERMVDEIDFSLF